MCRLRSWGPSIIAFALALLAGPSLHAGEEYTGQQVEMHFRDAEISAALHMISSASGLNLVMATNHRRFTGDFSDKWDAVLVKILETNGLTWRLEGNCLIAGRRGEPLVDPKLKVLEGSPAEPPVAMSIVNASLTDVVRSLFENQGLGTSKLDPDGPALRGYVTVSVIDISPRKLLQLVLAANGYGFEEIRGVIKIRPLPGFELPATHDATALTMADDVSNIILRGTLTPKKAGTTLVALVEMAGGEYLEVREGTTIPMARFVRVANSGWSEQFVEVKPDRVVVAIVKDGRTVGKNNTTLRIGDLHGYPSPQSTGRRPE